MSSVLHQEKAFTQTIASLAPPPESHERIMPGALYVLVAAMTGSIISRNRNILLRASMPFALGLGAAWVVLPVTTRNVGDLVWTYEERAPLIAENHMRIRGAVEEGWRQTKARGEATKKWSDERVRESREAIEAWVRKGK
jgi:organizing structure protein 2